MEDIKQYSRILIVDDDTKNIQILGTVLREKGYRIHVAQNGKDALENVREILPDLILLDVMMPHIDGFETCRIMKTFPEIKDVPVVFLTAKTEAYDLIKGFELGAADYITKPFNTVELLARVRTHLNLKHTLDRLEKSNHEQKELLHILCHDLTTPFSSLFHIFELMKTNYSRYEQEKDVYIKYAFTVINNSLQLMDIVRKMRSLEEYRIQLMPVSLKESLTLSFDMLRNRFDEKSIAFTADVPGDVMVVAEKTSFVHSVLNNLLSNAVKFSHPGGAVTVRAAAEEDGVELLIRDTGIGIPQDMLYHLFDLKKMKIRRGTAGEHGTGFGMNLVKKFVTAYDGTIEVISETQKNAPEAHGTTVKITLKKG